MKKIYKLLTAVGLLNTVALFIVLLPLPGVVPTHTNAANVVDGMSSKWMVLLMGVIALFIPLVKVFYAKALKQKEGEGKNERVGQIVYTVIFTFLIIASWMAYVMAASGAQMGDTLELPFDLIIGLPAAAMLIIMGNYMSIVKQNYFLGIRTPWTLMDETVWHKTHRLGAYMMIISGTVMAVFILVGNRFGNGLGMWGVVLTVVLMVVVPAAYSFLLYRKLHSVKKK